ncbi:hypothetical protein TKK_0013678 [Trichogramma kaykai]|uniref:CCHC-type domain-containing protein n=1 Tax=Trichogramma kaykai TaxID=54128 RepID=A0ABD2WHX5_9HYME
MSESGNSDEVDEPTRQEIIQQLESAGIQYSAKDSTKRLKGKLKKATEDTPREQSKSEVKPSEVNTVSAMTTIDSKVKLEFELGKNNWETFVERFELYFFANGISDEKKQAAILLTRVSADTYKLAKNLCHPEKLMDKKFNEVSKLLSDHLCPKPPETIERCKFYAAQQGPFEKLADFGARLKELSLNCNFADLETALRDQLVCGLKDHASKTELFKQEKLTYAGAYKIALAREKAEMNTTTAEKLSESNRHDDNIHSVKANDNKSHKNKSNSSLVCYCCEKPNHIARNCKHRQQTCRNCKRQGHLEAMCRSQKKKI